MEKGKISIIVPVYNAEKYIESCIMSLKEQTYKNIEIILVDDGSRDRSGEICRHFEKEDERIHYYKKENGGVSSARNYGLAKADGEYVMFCDSDDYADRAWCDTMLKEYEADTMLICSSKTAKNNDSVQPKVGESYRVVEDRKHFYQFYHNYTINPPWNKLYSRAVIDEAVLVFDESMSNGEDAVFNLKYLDKCSRIKFINAPLYYYNNENEASLTHKKNMSLFHNYMIIFNEIFKRFEDYGTDIKEIENELIEDMGLHTLDMLMFSARADYSTAKKEISGVFDSRYYEYLLEYSNRKGINAVLRFLMRKKCVWAVVVLLKLKHIL